MIGKFLKRHAAHVQGYRCTKDQHIEEPLPCLSRKSTCLGCASAVLVAFSSPSANSLCEPISLTGIDVKKPCQHCKDRSA